VVGGAGFLTRGRKASSIRRKNLGGRKKGTSESSIWNHLIISRRKLYRREGRVREVRGKGQTSGGGIRRAEQKPSGAE